MSNAKAALQKGDLAVIGMNGDADASTTIRSFAVVALNNIAKDEVIYFTDRGWVNTYTPASGSPISGHFVGAITNPTPSSVTGNEGIFQWKPSALISAGTVIIFKIDLGSTRVSGVKGDGSALPAADISILSGTWMNTTLSANPWSPGTGDQIMIYQGSESNPSFIFAFNNLKGNFANPSNGWTTNPSNTEPNNQLPAYGELPSALGTTYSIGFLTPTTNLRYPNEKYNPSFSGGTKAILLADITNADHWTNTTAAGSPYDFSAGFGSDKITEFEMRPSVMISSSAGSSGGTTLDSPIPFTVTFSEAVTGFEAGDITPGNGTINGFSGSGTTYTFNISPAAFGAVTVDIAENTALGSTSNGNTAAVQFVITYQQTLPVTLVSYSVKADGMAARLEWTTVSEKDNGHYEIEHSTDGKVFKVIGMVEVNGSSSVRRNYVWYDRYPATAINYYRLAQVDIDGTITRFKVKSLNFGVVIAAYPNPAMEKVSISFPKKTKSLQLMDVNGRMLRNFPIKENDTTITIPVSDLLPGNYLIRLLSANGAVSCKLIKR